MISLLKRERAAYIKRMRAYKLFIQKHNEINSKGMDEIRNYWVNFEYLINKNYIKIIFSSSATIRFKLVCIYYNSPFFVLSTK